MSNESSDILMNICLADDSNRERIEALFRYAQVGRCVNGVCHDINNYMGTILAYSELVQLEPGVSEEVQNTLEKVAKAIEKCSALVNALTTIARPVTYTVGFADLNKVIQGALLIRDYAFRLARIAVVTDLDETLPTLAGNAPQLQMLLLYLLLNSEEHLSQVTTEDRSLTLRSFKEGNLLCVSVRNSGPPVPESAAEAIFQPYATTRSGDCNIGMGLSLARQVAARHKGTLTYSNQDGFVLQLPVDAEL